MCIISASSYASEPSTAAQDGIGCFMERRTSVQRSKAVNSGCTGRNVVGFIALETFCASHIPCGACPAVNRADTQAAFLCLLDLAYHSSWELGHSDWSHSLPRLSLRCVFVSDSLPSLSFRLEAVVLVSLPLTRILVLPGDVFDLYNCGEWVATHIKGENPWVQFNMLQCLRQHSTMRSKLTPRSVVPQLGSYSTDLSWPWGERSQPH